MNTRMTRSAIGAALIILPLLLLTPLSAHAGGRRRVVAVSPPSHALEITFVGNAILDAGTIVWHGGTKKSSVSTSKVTMRIGEPSRDAHGTAIVRAFVETFDPSCTVRIDGVTLTTAPRIVRRSAPIGIATTYRIEIEVPVTAADGPLQTAIGWEVTTE
jgi:hypothetical protein